jgi:hypothetical protein
MRFVTLDVVPTRLPYTTGVDIDKLTLAVTAAKLPETVAPLTFPYRFGVDIEDVTLAMVADKLP